LANKRKTSGLVSCVFLGDAAVEEGVYHESANFAVLQELPVLFLCENNLYSVYSPLQVRQPPGRMIHDHAESYGMPTLYGDGNDVEEVFYKLVSALAYIRAGNGPAFCEFSTYRWREHCGPNYDNDLGYRTIEEFEEWQKRDPIPRYVRALRARGLVDDDRLDSIHAEIGAAVQDAFDFAEQSPFPGEKEAFRHVYATT